MSNKSLQKLRYLEARQKYNRALKNIREDNLMLEYAQSGLFAAIGKAAAPIFKSLKLTAMDISNELRWLGEQFLFRNDPKKLKEKRDDYNRKRDKLLKEWEPIVKDNMDAIKNADPFLTLALSPGLFFTTKGVQAGVAAGKTAAEIVGAEDWESMRAKINKFQTGTEENPNAGVEMGIGAIHDQMREQNNLLMKLNDLFVGRADAGDATAGAATAGPAGDTPSGGGLSEQDGATAPKKQPEETINPKKWVENFFEMTGIGDQFLDAAAESLELKTELLNDSVDSMQNTTAVMKLIATKDLDGFRQTLSQIVSDSKISSENVQGFKEIIPEMEKQALELTKTEGFADSIAKDKNTSVDALTEQDLLKAAMDTVFSEAKSKFDEDYKESVKKFVTEIDENHELLKLDDQTENLIAQQKGELYSAEDFLKVYDSYKKLYKDFDSTRKKAGL